MAISKHINLLFVNNNLMVRLIIIFFLASFSSCQGTLDCNEDSNISNSFSFDKENNYDYKSKYIPKKGRLYFYKRDSKNKNHFKSLDLRLANINNEQLNIFFKDPPDRLKAKYDYRLILDDSLLYDISNIEMKVDTAGRTMGGWAIGCKIMSFEINGKKYLANRYFDSLNFPFDSARKIK